MKIRLFDQFLQKDQQNCKISIGHFTIFNKKRVDYGYF